MTGDEAMRRISELMGAYYDNELQPLQLVSRIAQTVGEWEASK